MNQNLLAHAARLANAYDEELAPLTERLDEQFHHAVEGGVAVSAGRLERSAFDVQDVAGLSQVLHEPESASQIGVFQLRSKELESASSRRGHATGR
jgi:hypothetical protein